MNSPVTRASNGQPTTRLHHQDHPRARRRGRTLADLKLNSLPRHVNAIPKPAEWDSLPLVSGVLVSDIRGRRRRDELAEVMPGP
jgi:hypothetical protein